MDSAADAAVPARQPARTRRFPGGFLRLLGASMDGFVAGFAAGYVTTTALSGVGRHLLGFGPALDVAVTAVLVLAAVGVAWALFLVPVTAAAWARDRIAPMDPRAPAARRLRGALMVPLRVVGGVPRLGIGLMAAVLALIYVVVPAGIGGLVGPDAALAPWIWFAGFAGAALGLARAARRREGRVARFLAAAGLATAVVVAGSGVLLATSAGTAAHLVPPGGVLDGTASVRSSLPDPGASGPFAVRTFTYGSGTDRRDAFGAGATLRTPTVDARAALDPLDGFADEARAAWWGFGRDALPLNARVWMPEGEGPFPLVLIVHGNHAMGAPNEAGFAYLAEHLASRGFIAASVDESFLNGSWAGDWNGAEMSVRAWLLLLHLDQWRTWNADPGGMLEGRVDMGRVALVGHSRGGEAASVAAAWSSLAATFNPTLRPWPEGLSIRAVVSIAPSDGQVGQQVHLEGVDLLELTGGHDADARGWSGIRQYNRTTVADGRFKAALYASRANHGQFNTVWGAGDQGPFSAGLLNLAPLPTAADQEDVARTAVGAFLEASLMGRTGYRDLFRRPMAGREWLPDDVYVVRSDEGDALPLASTAAVGGMPAEGLRLVRERLAAVRTADLPLRALQDTQGGRAILLAWEGGTGDAVWGIEGLSSSSLADVQAGRWAIRLELANTDPGSADPGEVPVPLDPDVEVRTSDGVVVALPLSTWAAVPPPLATRLTKDGIVDALARVGGVDLSLRSPAEQVVQTWRIDLGTFAAADPAFRPDRLDRIVIRIPRSQPGSLAVAAFGLLPSD